MCALAQDIPLCLPDRFDHERVGSGEKTMVISCDIDYLDLWWMVMGYVLVVVM